MLDIIKYLIKLIKSILYGKFINLNEILLVV